MTATPKRLNQFNRGVMLRVRLLAVQDWTALCLLSSAAVSGVVILASRLAPLNSLMEPVSRVPLWALFSCAAASLVAAIIHLSRPRSCSFSAHATQSQAARLIDRTLRLEDRFATAQAIIAEARPLRPIEQALVRDVDSRVEPARPSSVAHYRIPNPAGAARCGGAAALAGVLALAAGVLVAKTLQPVIKANVAPVELVETGQKLEQSATEIEKEIAPETPTAQLAREQARVGRDLGQVREAEALRRLSSLAERLRARSEELRSTRADEIVSLAEKRFEAAVTAPARQRGTRATESDKHSAPEGSEEAKSEKPGAASHEATSAESADEGKRVGDAAPRNDSDNKTDTQGDSAAKRDPAKARPVTDPTSSEQSAADKGSSRAAVPANSPAAREQVGTEKAEGAEPAPVPSGTEQPTTEAEAGEKKEGMGSLLPLEQAAKLAPKLSEQLLQKASELRADQLKAEDIARIKQAAEALLGDLSNIQNSEELRRAFEQLARRVDPAQLEQVARQLMSQEKVRDELIAAMRLLTENRQAREMIAGFARRAAEAGARSSRQGSEPSGATADLGSLEARQPDSRRPLPSPSGKRLKPEATTRGTSPAEFVYAKPKAGEAVARVPYTAAYPSYRRQAERSVERGQVPPHLRSLVKTYFDSINPDAGVAKRP